MRGHTKNKTLKRLATFFVIVLLTGAAALGVKYRTPLTIRLSHFTDPTSFSAAHPIVHAIVDEYAQRIDERIQSKQFQEEMRIFAKSQILDEDMQAIDGKIAAIRAKAEEAITTQEGLKAEKAKQKLALQEQSQFLKQQYVLKVEAYLSAKNPALRTLAKQIMALPRWMEVLAIIGHETDFCRTRVGASQKNCGAVKNTKTMQFKTYASLMDSIADVSIVLTKPRLKEKSLAEMDDIYCVNEEVGHGACPGWSSDTTKYYGELASL